MAKHTLPNLGLTGGYAEGDTGWGEEQNANLLKLSVLTQGAVKGRVAAVPASPAEGDAYVLTADPNSDAIAVFDSGAWIYWLPKAGWSVYDTQANSQIRYNGSDWSVVPSGGGGGGGTGTGFLGSTVMRLETDTNIDTGSWVSPPTANWQILNDPLGAYAANSDVVVPDGATHLRCRAKTAWSNGGSTRAVRIARPDESDVQLLDIRGGTFETASTAAAPTQPVTAGSTLRVSYNTFQSAANVAGRGGTVFGRPCVVEFEWFNGWPQG